MSKNKRYFRYNHNEESWRCIECGRQQEENRRTWVRPENHERGCQTQKIAAKALLDAVTVLDRLSKSLNLEWKGVKANGHR